MILLNYFHCVILEIEQVCAESGPKEENVTKLRGTVETVL